MEMSDLKKKDVESLVAVAKELRESLRTIRFEGAGSRARDVKQAKALRRDVARIETELSVRRLAPKAE